MKRQAIPVPPLLPHRATTSTRPSPFRPFFPAPYVLSTPRTSGRSCGRCRRCHLTLLHGLTAVTLRLSTATRPEQREARRAWTPSPHAPPWARAPSPRAHAAAHQTWVQGERSEQREAPGTRGRGRSMGRETTTYEKTKISEMPNI
jgi:hypothetical protein